jgi:NCAIR mutase (PurE)-related protein
VDIRHLKRILESVQRGRITVDAAMERFKGLPFEDLDFAKIDSHRCIRTGFPEVIYCPGKTLDQIRKIADRSIQNHHNILATRAGSDVYTAIREVTPDCEYYETARIVVIHPRPLPRIGNIAVVCAGTADMPVGEEAAVTGEVLGNRVQRFYDVGVAGLHRLFSVREELFKARVAVVVAGMEGALASVIGGLVSCPVIAVPTSVGYGASFGGLAALLTMLNSCAAGVSVVNIDNGFGAGCQASLINKMDAPD